MKIVILGAAGQLGRQLCRSLPGEIVALTRADADLTKPGPLRQTLRELQPSVVVNAAGYTQVDRAEVEPLDAFSVNAMGVRELATICRDLDCTLIHVSTDYVFGLETLRGSPYGEDDAAGPINAYGNSKLAGESFVRNLCPKHFILRTCGLYGHLPSGSKQTNFVATMLRKADEQAVLRVVDDQICTPTSVADFAQAVRELLGSERYGLYHVTNAGACSWHEFARMVFEFAKKDVNLVPIKTEQYVTAARRPRYSVLSNEKWIGSGHSPLRSWHEALASHLAALK